MRGPPMDLERIVGRTRFDRIRFVTSVLMDILGAASYLGWFFPPAALLSEGSDTIFAPIQAAYLLLAYHRLDVAPAALVGAAEELLPGTDFIPTCTLYHVYAMRKKYGRAQTE